MIAELCLDVILTFQRLNTCLQTAKEHVCILDGQLPAWFQAPATLPLPTSATTREQACILLGQLEYLHNQQPREILVGAGIIAASSETIMVLQELNQSKANFKRAILRLKDAKIQVQQTYLRDQFEQLLPMRDTGVATSLSRVGLARLHLKQCYRKIPCFLSRPEKISWTWANTRSIKRISIQEAEQMLHKHVTDPGIERQLKLLGNLNSNEKLAIVQDLAPHLRANLVMPDGYSTKRVMVKGPVPIFYLTDDNLALPDFAPPGAKHGRNKDRVIRKDVKINPEPFLPAIRAHRYYM